MAICNVPKKCQRQGPAHHRRVPGYSACCHGLTRVLRFNAFGCQAAYRYRSRFHWEKQRRARLRVLKDARARMAFNGDIAKGQAGTAQCGSDRVDQAGWIITGQATLIALCAHLVTYQRVPRQIWESHARCSINECRFWALEKQSPASESESDRFRYRSSESINSMFFPVTDSISESVRDRNDPSLLQILKSIYISTIGYGECIAR